MISWIWSFKYKYSMKGNTCESSSSQMLYFEDTILKLILKAYTLVWQMKEHETFSDADNFVKKNYVKKIWVSLWTVLIKKWQVFLYSG